MSKARTSICADCGTSFTYEIVRGSHGRTYCPACRDARVLENKRIYKVRHRGGPGRIPAQLLLIGGV